MVAEPECRLSRPKIRSAMSCRRHRKGGPYAAGLETWTSRAWKPVVRMIVGVSVPMGFPLPRQPSSKPPSKWFTQEGVPDVPLAPVMRKMLLALSPAMAARMVGQVANLNAWIDDSCLDGLPLTTTCSGTDLILPVLNLFFLIATSMMGVPLIQPRHLWSCKSDSQKAAWITQVMGIGRIFADVGDLSSGLAKEHFTSLMGQVSSGLIHACGFNCQSVSGLNKQRKMFNRCIRKRKGKTGVSWWGTFSYVRRFLPLFVWLENVSTLRGDNLADVLSLLRMIGYIVVHFVLDHCHHKHYLNKKIH